VLGSPGAESPTSIFMSTSCGLQSPVGWASGARFGFCWRSGSVCCCRSGFCCGCCRGDWLPAVVESAAGVVEVVSGGAEVCLASPAALSSALSSARPEPLTRNQTSAATSATATTSTTRRVQ
jgi:hypothetical protein